MMCPKCKVVRKSPLGHLSHLYVCGLSDEEQNSYKITCEHCELKIFPFSSTAHKKSCKLRVMPISEAPQISAEDDVEGLGMSLDSSGRLKRKAVRRAEKKMKKIIDDQDQPIDHVKTTNNVSRCSLCGNMYSTLQEALDHIERDHKSDMKDFEDSGSEASFHREESSDTDGTSGISEGLSVCSSPANKSVAKVVQKTTNKR